MNVTVKQNHFGIRWLYLAVGVIVLLFAGIIYGWSILKAPLAADFGWTADQLALNFTLTMCFFCLGGIAGGVLAKRLGICPSLILAGVLSCLGFFLTARLDGGSAAMLYVSYGLLAGLGIGIAYNVIISTVNAWFPDKKGTCSGALMMGFGASALVVGNTMSALMENPAIGWRTAFIGLGVVLGVILLATGLIIQLPPAGLELPKPAQKSGAASEDFEARDYTPGEMIRRFTFWRAFVCIVFLAAVGNTVISFARDLSISVGAEAGLATTLVGVLSVCNGLGRIATGAIFDKLGRRKTMLLANIVAIAAAGVTLLSVFTGSVPLCVAGLCVTGFSYGSCPTISSAFVSAFYGTKHFSMNFSIMNFNLMGASLLATVSSMLFTSSGGYVAPFILLLALSAVALVLNLSIKKP
jgi:OFA family oxalate/formate antiporter-like MFS transporter